MAPGDRCFHQHVLAGAERRQRDNELGQVAERGVEQSADGVAGLRGNRFGGVAQQRRQRHDREHGQDEQQRRAIRWRPTSAMKSTGTNTSSHKNGL